MGRRKARLRGLGRCAPALRGFGWGLFVSLLGLPILVALVVLVVAEGEGECVGGRSGCAGVRGGGGCPEARGDKLG